MHVSTSTPTLRTHRHILVHIRILTLHAQISSLIVQTQPILTRIRAPVRTRVITIVLIVISTLVRLFYYDFDLQNNHYVLPHMQYFYGVFTF